MRPGETIIPLPPGLPAPSPQSPSYWLTRDGQLDQAIREGLREAGVLGPLFFLVGPILRAVIRVLDQ